MTNRPPDHDQRDDDPDAPPTAEEADEARALARALDGGEAAGDGAHAPRAPAGALEAAALLRDAGGRVSLPPARAAAVAAKLEPALAALATRAAAAPEARPRLRRRRWTLVSTLSGMAAAAAVTALVLVARAPERGSPPAPARAAAAPPPPPVGLLRAQAEAARGGAQALAALDREMRAYRRRYFDELGRAGAGGEPPR